jgi:hypothetical protein
MELTATIDVQVASVVANDTYNFVDDDSGNGTTLPIKDRGWWH